MTYIPSSERCTENLPKISVRTIISSFTLHDLNLSPEIIHMPRKPVIDVASKN